MRSRRIQLRIDPTDVSQGEAFGEAYRDNSRFGEHIDQPRLKRALTTLPAPESRRAFRGEIFCRLEQLWLRHRAVSLCPARQNSTDKGGPGLSSFSIRSNPDPSSDAQKIGRAHV